MNDRAPDEPDPMPSGGDDRRATWSRRIAIGVLVVFAMFVVFNIVTVLVLAYQSVVEAQGGLFP
jgi:hypothetical protein